MAQEEPKSALTPSSPDTPPERAEPPAAQSVPSASESQAPPEAQAQPESQAQPAPPTVQAAPAVSADSAEAQKPPAEAQALPETATSTPEAGALAAGTPAPAVAGSTAPDPCAEETSKFALVVDDEPANRDFLVRLLEQARLEVKGACDAADALNKLANVPCARLIAIDHKLPDMDGVDLLAQLRPRYPHARLIMATMHDDRALMEKAFNSGCDVFLVKPHGFMELFRRVQLLDSHEDGMQKLIIDQYGPRPYRG